MTILKADASALLRYPVFQAGTMPAEQEILNPGFFLLLQSGVFRNVSDFDDAGGITGLNQGELPSWHG